MGRGEDRKGEISPQEDGHATILSPFLNLSGFWTGVHTCPVFFKLLGPVFELHSTT